MNIRQLGSVFNYLQVFVERCKYLEESKCVGICINTCKLPTQVSIYMDGIVQLTCNLGALTLSSCNLVLQSFFKDCMGVPLVMEPNFSDYSCQVNPGSLPSSFFLKL